MFSITIKHSVDCPEQIYALKLQEIKYANILIFKATLGDLRFQRASEKSLQTFIV